MSDALTDNKPLDPASAAVFAKVRRLMLVSGATMFVAIAAVVFVIGYRVFRAEGSAAPAPNADVTARLPKGARVVAISAAGDRIVVTVEVAGALEARTFDARTLAPTGRLRFGTEPQP